MSTSSKHLEIQEADKFGPWREDLDETERKARWRVLAALALVYAGGAHPLMRACLSAEEGDRGASAKAWVALMNLTPLVRRRLLSAYIGLAELARSRRISDDTVTGTKPAPAMGKGR